MARAPRGYVPILPMTPPAVAPAAPTPAELLADGVVDLKTAAEMCGHCLRWITQQIERGELPSFIVKRKRVIPRKAVIDFLASRMIKAAG